MTTTPLDQLEQVLRRLPPRYKASEAILAGGASMIALFLNVATDDLVATGLFGGADGTWLDLHSRGYGVVRGSGETDEQLRTRLRSVGDSVTRSAILEAVDALLAPLTGVAAVMVEHWQEPLVLDTDDLDYALICDNSYMRDALNSFTLIIPDFGDPPLPIYSAISAEVERLRGGGIRWALLLSGAP